MSSTDPKPDIELELLKQVQARGKERKIAALSRLSRALDLAIEITAEGVVEITNQQAPR